MFQASSVSRRLWNTSKALSSFMDAHVVPSCKARGIPCPISRDLFQELATDKTMRFVHDLTNSPSQMRDLITAMPKIRDFPLRLYRRFEKKWENNLRELAEYKLMKGHTLVPQAYAVNGLNLGVWVNNQRTQYALKEKGEPSFLTVERVRLLNDLSFAWSALDEIWENNLRELAEYKLMKGHTLVHREYAVNGLNLGVWVSNQRTQYTLNEKGEPSQMTAERVRLLNDLGFVWKARDEIWDNNLRELAEYKIDHNGNVCVPIAYVVNGLNLGIWVSTQRTQYALKEKGEPSSLTVERVRLLNDLGFVWKALEAQWLENYKALIEYKNDNNGNVCVPRRYKTEEGTKLGLWVSVQRHQYSLKERDEHSQMTDERIRLLNDLEFVWRLRG